MHELTRRRICRVAFVVLCALPTSGILAWGAARRSPARLAAHVAELERAIGLPISVEAVSYPRPGATLLHSLELHDPETGAAMLTCRLLEVASDGDRCVLRASSAEIDAAFVPQLWQALERRLRRTAHDADPPWSLVARELTWRGPHAAQTFTDLAGQLVADDSVHRAELAFHLAGASADEMIAVRASRRAADRPGATNVTLDTGHGSLPANVFVPLVEAAACLGARAEFRGKLSIDLRPTGWAGHLAGEFDAVDLDSLVSAQFPHTLSGAATLRVDHAQLDQGRLVEAAAGVSAGPGVISRSLLVSAGSMLGLFDRDTMIPASQHLPFDRMTFDVTIDEAGLRFLGLAPCNTRGAMLVDTSATGQPRALWTQPERQPQPVVALLRALVPESEVQVPATRESDWLIHHLPVPPLAAPAANVASPPTGHLRSLK
ncbi:MAG TPA: hypothetical protein VG713_16115 [Pirellulales bacterium]|nr:hypothetical protein [Pirellulales bacterium]